MKTNEKVQGVGPDIQAVRDFGLDHDQIIVSKDDEIIR
jgi:hypothetical protein